MNGDTNNGGSVLDSVERIARIYADFRLAREIDSEFDRPWSVNDPAAWQWSVGPRGQLYQRGQPASAAAALLSNPLIVLAGVAVLGAVAFYALKG